jgi:putative membrane protein
MKTTPPLVNSSLRACAIAASLFAVNAFAASANPDAPKTHDHMNTAATTTGQNTAASLTHTDKHFIEKAAAAGREEVEISQVAAQRSTNADVKSFAQMMVDDHSKANDELMSIAQSRGVVLDDKKNETEKWSKKDAKDFDRDYVKKMVSDHKDVVELFQKEAKDGTDPDLLAFARSTLPKLEKHYEHATDLKKMVR